MKTAIAGVILVWVILAVAFIIAGKTWVLAGAFLLGWGAGDLAGTIVKFCLKRIWWA